MMKTENVNQPGVSFLEQQSWDELLPFTNEKYLPDEFTCLPASFQKEVIHAISEISRPESGHLSPEMKDAGYNSSLQQAFRIDQFNPNIPDALTNRPQKTIAHALLAFAGLTESESHVMSLRDTKSIIAHALYYYQKGLKPWFDFSVMNDYSSKSKQDVQTKTAAPLYKSDQCPTFYDFFTKVIPKIHEIRSLDAHADIKIFPQTKNVETFNIVFHRNDDGSTSLIVEWFPGAYTPRDGEDEGQKKVTKNRTLSKEERIVRTILHFDKYGNAIVGLKPQKDSKGRDMPFKYPTDTVDVNTLFEKAEIFGNHDDMVSSNNPFTFLKYLTTHPGFRNLLTGFQKVHAQLGYADLALSGMIGPDTIFAIDMDYETPKSFGNDAEYIEWCRKNNRQLTPISYAKLLDNLQHAPILHELDLIEITSFYWNVFIIFNYLDNPDIDNLYAYNRAIHTIAGNLGMLEVTENEQVHLVNIPIVSRTPIQQPVMANQLLNHHELFLLTSVINHYYKHRPFPILPTEMDVLHAEYRETHPILLHQLRNVASL